MLHSSVYPEWVNPQNVISKAKRACELSKQYIQNYYLDLCKDNGIPKHEDALHLSQYFHDIGVFLHFQDDELLNKTIFLKPNWATNAVYKILDHPQLNKSNGRFNKEDAKSIWKGDEFVLIRDELLKLMQKFFLTYEIDNSGEYIVPERLPQNQPDYECGKENLLSLRYEYDVFMPKGIISSFIVQMHRYIKDQTLVWKKGVVIERDKTNADVIESFDLRKIWIRVWGKHKRDFMTIITEQLDAINARYEKLKVNKMIPCYCDKCKTNTEPHFYLYNDLKRRIKNGREEVECNISYQMVKVQRLIDEVINKDVGQEDNKIFISYSHENRDWLEKVQTQLEVLKNEGLPINLCADTKIKPGEIWRDEIEKGLS